MNFLDTLKDEERTLLVSLPYRVGLFVSESDQTGGGESDQAELAALSNILMGYSQEVFGAETVQYVINDTVHRKGDWEVWGKDIGFESIERDCLRAIDILNAHVDPKEVKAYKSHLVEIGESVALAFREYGHQTSIIDKIKTRIYYWRDKQHAAKFGLPFKHWDEFINISLSERRALRAIAGTLGVMYI